VSLTRAGDYGAAGAAFDAAVALEGGNPFLYLNRGLNSQRAGDYEGARADFERALALKPDCADALAALGLVCYETGRVDEAEDCYLKALAAERSGAALNNLGVLYFARGRLDEARRCFEEALEAFPPCADARFNLDDGFGEE
jgi:tetratricopeptide (TPR) repeat protein